MIDFQEICKGNLQLDYIKKVRVFQKQAVLQSAGPFQTNNQTTTTLFPYARYILGSALYNVRYENCPSLRVDILLLLSPYFKGGSWSSLLKSSGTISKSNGFKSKDRIKAWFKPISFFQLQLTEHPTVLCGFSSKNLRHPRAKVWLDILKWTNSTLAVPVLSKLMSRNLPWHPFLSYGYD